MPNRRQAPETRSDSHRDESRFAHIKHLYHDIEEREERNEAIERDEAPNRLVIRILIVVALIGWTIFMAWFGIQSLRKKEPAAQIRYYQFAATLPT